MVFKSLDGLYRCRVNLSASADLSNFLGLLDS